MARSRPKRSSSKALSGAFALSLILLGALVGVGFLMAIQNQRQAAVDREAEERAAAEAEVSPFADMPPEAARVERREALEAAERKDDPFGDIGTSDERAGGDFGQDRVWRQALGFAKRGKRAYDDAYAKRRLGDEAEYLELLRASRRLYEQALEETGTFEQGLIAAHGAEDPLVKEIVGVRTRWSMKLSVLRKALGR